MTMGWIWVSFDLSTVYNILLWEQSAPKHDYDTEMEELTEENI